MTHYSAPMQYTYNKYLAKMGALCEYFQEYYAFDPSLPAHNKGSTVGNN